MYVAPTRGRYEKNYSISFGRYRPRFPGAGRRKQSYDSLLQVFAKKVSPARFRRVSTLRFPRPVVRLTGDYRQDHRLLRSHRTLNRRRALARKLTRTAYMSANWRRLLNYRTAVPTTLEVRAYTGCVVDAQLAGPVVKAGACFPAQYGKPFSGVKRRFASLPARRVYKKTCR